MHADPKMLNVSEAACKSFPMDVRIAISEMGVLPVWAYFLHILSFLSDTYIIVMPYIRI